MQLLILLIHQICQIAFIHQNLDFLILFMAKINLIVFREMVSYVNNSQT